MQLRSLCSQVHAVSYLSPCCREMSIAEQRFSEEELANDAEPEPQRLRVPWNTVPAVRETWGPQLAH